MTTQMTIQEKRHADFEDWMKKQGLESEWQPDRNAYAHFSAHFAWNAWCAAIDGLVIELPEQSPETPFSRHMVMDSSSVIEAIESAGVRVKP